MAQERTERKPYVMDVFPGYHRTTEASSYDAPPGSLNSDSTNYLVTNTGKIAGAWGSALMSTSGLTRGRQTYWWQRPRSGGVALLEGLTSLYVLSPGPPQGLWTALDGDAGISSTDQRDQIGHFTSYGDFTFYVNGVDKPKKIRRHDLRAYEMGLTPPSDDEMPTEYYVLNNAYMSSHGLGIGVYEYKFTFVYQSGGESNGSNKTFRLKIPSDAETFRIFGSREDVVGVDSLKMFPFFDGFPAEASYPRDDIQGMNVYRRRVGSGSFFKVGFISRGHRSFLDTTPDEFATAVMPIDHDEPPVARYVAVHDDRVWFGGSLGEGAGDLVRYSRRGLPDIVPPGYVIPQSEWVNAGRMTGIKSLAGVLYFTFEKAVFRLEGSRPEDYQLAPISESMGCIAPETLRGWRDALLFLSRRGPAIARGNQTQVIEGPMRYDLEDIHFQDLRNACAAVVRDHYVVSFPSTEAQWTPTVDGASPQMTRVFAVNLTNASVGSIQDHFDIASDDGPYGLPMVARFLVASVGTSTTTPRVLGYGRKYFSEEAANYMDLQFHWTNLEEPSEKTLDAVEVDLGCYSPKDIEITVFDEGGASITYDGSDTEVEVTPTPPTVATWDTDQWGSDAATLYPEEQIFTMKFPTSDATTPHLTGRRFRIRIRETTGAAVPVLSRQPVTLYQIRWYYDLINRRG